MLNGFYDLCNYEFPWFKLSEGSEGYSYHCICRTFEACMILCSQVLVSVRESVGYLLSYLSSSPSSLFFPLYFFHTLACLYQYITPAWSGLPIWSIINLKKQGVLLCIEVYCCTRTWRKEWVEIDKPFSAVTKVSPGKHAQGSTWPGKIVRCTVGHVCQ